MGTAFQVRMQDDDRQLIDAAAKSARTTASHWARMVLLAAARAQLGGDDEMARMNYQRPRFQTAGKVLETVNGGGAPGVFPVKHSDGGQSKAEMRAETDRLIAESGVIPTVVPAVQVEPKPRGLVRLVREPTEIEAHALRAVATRRSAGFFPGDDEVRAACEALVTIGAVDRRDVADDEMFTVTPLGEAWAAAHPAPVRKVELEPEPQPAAAPTLSLLPWGDA